MSTWQYVNRVPLARCAVVRRGAAALAAQPLIGLLAGACGREGTTAGSGGAPVQITFLNTSVSNATAHQPQIDEFHRRTPSIVVEQIAAQGSPFMDKLQAMVAAGTPPDTTALSPDQLGVLASAKQLQDLGPFVRQQRVDLDDILPALRAQGQFKGVQYGIPRSGGFQGTFVNLSLLRAAGLPNPADLDARGQWTWDTHLDLARRLTAQDAGRFGTARGVWDMWFYEGGGELLDQAGSKPLLDSPDAVRSLQFMADLIHRHQVAPANAQNAQQGEQARFTSGQLGFFFGVRGFLFGFSTAITDFELGLVAAPRGKTKATTGSSAQSVLLVGSPHAAETFRFINWYTGAEGIRLHIATTNDGMMPARRSVVESKEFLGWTAGSLKAPNLNSMWAEEVKAGRVKGHPVHPRLAEILQAITQELAPLFAGTRNAQASLEAAVGAVRPFLQTT